MARNAEKAMTTLARWRASKEEQAGKNERRPYLASECTDVRKCEKWRLEIIREISKKVAQIQNAGLGEFRIRDLNDEINKLLREKRHWENQISELGGPHYRRYGPKMFDNEGKEVPGNRGYKYFGAAKDLPGVRELFEQEPPAPPRKSRAEMMKDIDADYYGYLDDDDGILVPLEQEAERIAIENAMTEWKSQRAAKEGEIEVDEEDIYAEFKENDEGHDADNPLEKLGPTHATLKKIIPSQKDIEEALLKKKKLELLKRYGIDGMDDDEE